MTTEDEWVAQHVRIARKLPRRQGAERKGIWHYHALYAGAPFGLCGTWAAYGWEDGKVARPTCPKCAKVLEEGLLVHMRPKATGGRQDD